MNAADQLADERHLIAAAQADPRRFAELYELHFERVYAYVARRVAGRAEVEDITSEVFHQALVHLRQFEWRGAPFAAWLYRIAANGIADRRRRAKREQGNPVHGQTAIQADPELEAVERRARLFALVRELSADQQRVVQLRFVEEKSIREIAQALGRSEGAVKQLQFRALEALRARLSGSDD